MRDVLDKVHNKLADLIEAYDDAELAFRFIKQRYGSDLIIRVRTNDLVFSRRFSAFMLDTARADLYEHIVNEMIDDIKKAS